MTINSTLSDQLASLPREPSRSRPRCICHNFYIERCPTIPPWEKQRITGVMNQIASLDTPNMDLLCECRHFSSRHYKGSGYCTECPKGNICVSFRRKQFKKDLCKKQGHKSPWAAEAQLRSILKRRESGNYPTEKNDELLEVYKCKRNECKAHPYHVGHNPYSQRELNLKERKPS